MDSSSRICSLRQLTFLLSRKHTIPPSRNRSVYIQSVFRIPLTIESDGPLFLMNEECATLPADAEESFFI